MAKKKEIKMALVQSAVKEIIKETGMQSSGDLLPALNEKVHTLITDAAARTKTNGRMTVRAGDL